MRRRISILLFSIGLHCQLLPPRIGHRPSSAPAIIPIAGDEIATGSLVIEKGRSSPSARPARCKIPADAERVDVAGQGHHAGLVCTHSHIGGSALGGADGSGPIQPGVRILDSINVHDSGFKRAVAGGLTTLNIMPGSGHLISGQTVYVKLRLNPKAAKDRRLFHARRRTACRWAA